VRRRQDEKAENRKESFCFELFLLHHRRGSKTSAVSSAAVGAQLRILPPQWCRREREESEGRKERLTFFSLQPGNNFLFLSATLSLHALQSTALPSGANLIHRTSALSSRKEEKRQRESDFNRQLLNGWKGAIFLAPFFSPPPPPPFPSLPPLLYL